MGALEQINTAIKTRATSLIIEDSKIKSLPKEIGKLIDLKSLKIRCTSIRTLPKEIGQLKNLISLELICSNYWDEHLRHLEDLGHLTDLQFLMVKSDAKFPEEIGQLKNLSSLEWTFSSGGYDCLPEAIGHLTNLKSLVIRETHWGTIPTQICQLKNLTSLTINCEEIKTLPAEIGQLKNLTSLTINCRGLRTLPAEIGHLTKLSILNVGRDCYTIPEEISKLRNLSTLSWCMSNPTSAEIIKLSNIPSLLHLVIYTGKLGPLPAEIRELTNLQSLEIVCGDRLVSIPNEIGHLTNLKSLKICHKEGFYYDYDARHVALPREIGQLINLISLEIFLYNLSSLPTEIGNLTNLERLVIHSPSLSDLPRELGRLRNLITIDIEYGGKKPSNSPFDFYNLNRLKEFRMNISKKNELVTTGFQSIRFLMFGKKQVQSAEHS